MGNRAKSANKASHPLLWTAALVLASCAPPTLLEVGPEPPELMLEGVGLKFFRGSELRATGRASLTSFRRDTGDLTAHRVRLNIRQDGATDEIVTLDAVSATGNLRGQVADGAGGVHLADSRGNRGTTERAHLDGKTGLATGQDPVDVVGQGFRMHGENGFLLDLVGTSGLSLEGPVTTLVRGTP